MQIHLKSLTTFDSSRVKYFDLHKESGFASIVERDEAVALDLNGAVIRSWPKGDQPEIWWIKWFDANHVVLDLDGRKIAIISATAWKQYELGYRSDLYLSPKFMLAIYGEEQFYSSRSGDLEGHLISVFSRNGTFEFGLRDLMDKDRDSWKLEELTAGYTFEDNFSFVAWDSRLLWILNVPEKKWKKVPFAFSAVGIDVLSGDDKTAYAIFDHRNLLRHYPDRPPFELAVFDLLSETSSKHDFAPIERELLASGFEMSEIKFQPNSTGKIIVSDANKAALLEFSGVA